MAWSRKRLRSDLGKYVQDYSRTPNRRNDDDPRLPKMMRRMKPEDLDALIRDEDPDERDSD